MPNETPALRGSPRGLVEALCIAFVDLTRIVYQQARLLHRFPGEQGRLVEGNAMIAQPEREAAVLRQPVEPLDQQRGPRLAPLPRTLRLDNLGELRIRLARSLQIMLQDMAQHQRIGEAVRQMM